MAFKTTKGGGASLDTPEVLFNDLRSRQVKGLLAHQADILREYAKDGVARADVAIQMPTGSGKTLVGLLIAEWRRRKFGTSALYVCPTNQLVHQVTEQALTRYGINALAFTGPKSEYKPADGAAYQAAEAVAVTSYSSLFNVKPFFDAPQTIVLDDAHSAEGYIASTWSVRIERTNKAHATLFEAAVAILKPLLTQSDGRRLTGDITSRWDSTWVEKLPTPRFLEIAEDLASLIDTHAPSTDLRFSWSWLRNNLHACHIYISAYDILIRPIIPPTFTHRPFATATQRIYMSATLGEGGDLERITGRKSIHRLAGPKAWEHQSIGRRYFVFAERALDQVSAQDVYLGFISLAGRALFLVPDDRSGQSVREWLQKKAKCKLFSAKDIEQSKQAFTSSASAVAVAANRYDGIDLAEDECRLMFMEGVPGAGDLQERFLVTRMGAGRVLDDRILTRIVQAFGRCTRSTTDYAAVVVCGQGLHKYLLRADRRQFFHPELQAELQFGIDQSKEATAKDFLDNMKLFLDQSPEWKAAEGEIVQLRSARTQAPLPGSDQLRIAVSSEVAYAEALWTGNFDLALDAARSVLSSLAGDDLKGYRAFWYYLAGSAAWLGFRSGGNALETVAREFFDNARKATNGVRWLYELTKQWSPADPGTAEVDPLSLQLLERLEERFDSMGTLNNKKYDELELTIRNGLSSDDSTTFEQAQERLGWLLGYDSGRSTEQGAPDPWWATGDTFCVVFEDYTEAKESSAVSITKARQAASHPKWISQHLGLGSEAGILPILVSSATSMAKEAAPHLKEVFLWPLPAFREWAAKALQTVRQLRTDYTESGDLAWRANAASAYEKAQLSPRALSRLVTASRASEVLTRQ